MFSTLSDRLAATFKSLRGKGRLSPSDVDATVREIRRALLDADVALPVVREFTATVQSLDGVPFTPAWYEWDFGDGALDATADPVAIHDYSGLAQKTDPVRPPLG